MNSSLSRRQFLRALSAVPFLTSFGLNERALAASTSMRLGASRRFDFAQLRAQAQARAAQPYQPPKLPTDLLQKIDFDLQQKIRYRADHTLWGTPDRPLGVRFFHLHRYVQQPVRIYTVNGDQAREVLYSPALFDYAGTHLDERLPKDLGFAGFRVLNPSKETDWLAFQGASYFRSSGELDQYGLSARGLAIDAGLTPEEFPRFTDFWLEEPAGQSQRIFIYALLDGPSVSGVYRFDCHKQGEVIVDVHAELFMRQSVKRLGIAPLTSMFWYGEQNHAQALDWRPEIHDSDGLALWTGAGERIWRPLNNPPYAITSSFTDIDPRGFGLLQRDRDFTHYEDDGAFYERRPSVWIEPLGAWGAGAVQLVELPTDDEIHDNIVAYWLPQQAPTPGQSAVFEYRMHWTAEEPYTPQAVAHVVSSRTGRAGIPGQEDARVNNARKFVIDFRGGPLASLPQRFDLQPMVSASRGKIINPYALKVVSTDRWRAVFDLQVDGNEPVELRCFVRLGDKTLTETWLYQYHPAIH
jgi:glucans biosynthesis protein